MIKWTEEKINSILILKGTLTLCIKEAIFNHGTIHLSDSETLDHY